MASSPSEENRPRPETGAGETERYRTLLEINNTLIANLTREALFRAIAEAVRRVVPFDRTAIFLHDPGTSRKESVTMRPLSFGHASGATTGFGPDGTVLTSVRVSMRIPQSGERLPPSLPRGGY